MALTDRWRRAPPRSLQEGLPTQLLALQAPPHHLLSSGLRPQSPEEGRQPSAPFSRPSVGAAISDFSDKLEGIWQSEQYFQL